MTHTVHRHGGTLDKFIGDAVMAFWNAPMAEPAHAARALACAQDMQRDMQALRSQWQGTPFAALHLRIGLHTGEASVGHLGLQAAFHLYGRGGCGQHGGPSGVCQQVLWYRHPALRGHLPGPGRRRCGVAAPGVAGFRGSRRPPGGHRCIHAVRGRCPRGHQPGTARPCTCRPLVAGAAAFVRHWRLRSTNHAPSLRCQADRLEARIRALMLERPSSGVDVPNVRFGARELNKS